MPSSSQSAGLMQQVMRWGCRGIKLAEQILDWTEKIPAWIAPLAARISVALVFLRSGQLKLDGWFSVSGTTVYQFGHDFGLPFPALTASLATIGEHVFPLMLILGLGTRFAAAGLLGMTLVIQFVQPAGWPMHVLWAALLLYLLTQGGGRIALDRQAQGFLSRFAPVKQD